MICRELRPSRSDVGPDHHRTGVPTAWILPKLLGMALILGIESSCDETAAAIVEDGRWVLCNIIASQHELHERYGGVVPEIASRAHIERVTPVLTDALQAAGQTLGRPHDQPLTFDDIDAIAVGNRPGLIGSLLVGLSAAKAIATRLLRSTCIPVTSTVTSVMTEILLSSV